MKDARIRIEWAKKHINDLKTTLKAFGDTNPSRIFMEFDSQTNEKVYKAILEKPMPDEVPLIVGDAIHNLRASLDYAVVEKGKRDGAVDFHKLALPFSESSQAFFRSGSQRRMETMSSSTRDFIKNQEPYNGGNEPLVAIHDMDRFHKHREIIVIGTRAAVVSSHIHVAMTNSPGGIGLAFNPQGWGNLESGVELARISADSYSDIDLQLGSAIAFTAGFYAGRKVMPVLNELVSVATTFVDGIERS